MLVCVAGVSFCLCGVLVVLVAVVCVARVAYMKVTPQLQIVFISAEGYK